MTFIVFKNNAKKDQLFYNTSEIKLQDYIYKSFLYVPMFAPVGSVCGRNPE